MTESRCHLSILETIVMNKLSHLISTWVAVRCYVPDETSIRQIQIWDTSKTNHLLTCFVTRMLVRIPLMAVFGGFASWGGRPIGRMSQVSPTLRLSSSVLDIISCYALLIGGRTLSLRSCWMSLGKNINFWSHLCNGGRLRGLVGSVLEYGSLPPAFESRCRHMWRVLLFHLWLRFITFGGRSTHLAYPVHKIDDCETSNSIIICAMSVANL